MWAIPRFRHLPYERNNATLRRFKQNGHSGEEIEGTMMRGCWKTTFSQELVRILIYIVLILAVLTDVKISHLERLTRPLVKENQDSIDLVNSYLRGATSERRGTL